MKVNKIIYSLICLAMFCKVANGQARQPHSLYFMETIPQVSQVNPAFQPRANGYVMLPANLNIDYFNDLAVQDILQKHGNKWYTPVEKQYDYNKLYKSIGKKAAMIGIEVDWDVIGFGFRTAGNGYFSFGVSEHGFGNFALPRDMYKITDKGFPDNTTFDFSPLNAQAISYMQFLIGYSAKVNDRLSVGVNIKPLFGQLALKTKIDKFKLHTSEQEWELDTKGSVYSSLPVDEVITDAEGNIDKIESKDLDDYKVKDLVKDYVTSLNNPGIAVDLGAAYQVTERLNVSASLNNLGFISWKNDLNGIAFSGKYTFKGVYYDTSKGDDLEDLFKNLGDSIADAMSYVVQHNKFKTVLPPALHAGAAYDLSRSMSVGFLSRSVFWPKGVSQSFNASFNLQPYSFFSLNAGATWQVKGSVYLGGGFMFLLGPLQFYLLADYIPVRYSNIYIDGDKLFPAPNQFKTITARFGLNFVFGRHGYANKPMLDQGKSSWN